ncbi:hypothetical protein JTE90_008381 [Oedothorax gibbosus]|uniref:Protein FAM177A1 n=1 Tax=Oedothorax gibbosus TaxID=931172 RepID=A0AAV6V2T5_9ARAC|nr:hypothetical protein JTE90_008381 [Oedothorax gibbosus]
MVKETPGKSFTEIDLTVNKAKKAPKRLVYFSDGILEEYSSEDEVDHETVTEKLLVDPKTLPWIPYFGHMFWYMGSRALAVCDYLGENLAWFLGITSPKFQYELDQFEKMAKEEEELQKHIKAENAGWCNTDSNEKQPETIALQPQLTETPEILIKQDIESCIPTERKLSKTECNGKF